MANADSIKVEVSMKDVLRPPVYIMTNEVSFSEVQSELQHFVDQLDVRSPDGELKLTNYVVAVFDDYFIYEARVYDGTSNMYRRNYEVNDDTNEVIVAEEITEVRQEVSYVPINNTEEQTTNKNKEDVDVKKDELVQSIIDNEAMPFCDKSREYLNGMDEEALGKLRALTEKQEEDITEEGTDTAATAEQEEAGEDTAATNEEKGNEEVPVTTDAYINAAPAEVQDVLKESLALHRAQHSELVSKIVGNARNSFRKEELEAKPLGELKALAKLADVPVDFSANAGSAKDEVTTDLGEGLTMPAVNWGKKNEKAVA